ncbi:MAG: tripartite tricarboxylate transporter substrate binding protein [Xanthobacteraceae bacterium]
MRTCMIWLLALVGLCAHGAVAQEYPARPVKLIIPFAAGAGTDLTGRIVAQELGKRLGQQFIVENRPGAAGQLGTDLVAKSDPDGYTLLWTVSDGLSVLPAVKQLPYKVPDDFAFIGSIAQQPYTLAVSTRSNFKAFSDLVAYAKSHPGRLNYGSAGLGSAPHLTMAMIAAKAGIQMVHIPFAGLGPATNALVAGTVDVGLVIPVQAKQLIDTGKIRALATTGGKRSRVLPDVPTLREVGVNGTAVISYGLLAPARTDERIVDRLRHTLNDMMGDKAFTDHLYAMGFEVRPLIGDAYRDFIAKDLEKWRAVAKAGNVKIGN